MSIPSVPCIVFGAPGLAILYRVRASKLFGYPARGLTRDGVPVGPDHYIPPLAYGWTVHQAAIMQHPTESLWATLHYDPAVDGDSENLLPGELTYMEDLVDDGVFLDLGWLDATYYEAP